MATNDNLSDVLPESGYVRRSQLIPSIVTLSLAHGEQCHG